MHGENLKLNLNLLLKIYNTLETDTLSSNKLPNYMLKKYAWKLVVAHRISYSYGTQIFIKLCIAVRHLIISWNSLTCPSHKNLLLCYQF